MIENFLGIQRGEGDSGDKNKMVTTSTSALFIKIVRDDLLSPGEYSIRISVMYNSSCLLLLICIREM